ncbi:hypothetical protein KIN20_009805 [Parelaphostrongylus tenuis]|uniref:Uncharacterized protein n=1 Tax=Parelaphostrongylus tenuis TaxID=148309 RepID=A0AAD5MA23_PARTN|nr:hypothetical protein KIN20_009805 [Parelaphostrongylus tenuis]
MEIVLLLLLFQCAHTTKTIGHEFISTERTPFSAKEDIFYNDDSKIFSLTPNSKIRISIKASRHAEPKQPGIEPQPPGQEQIDVRKNKSPRKGIRNMLILNITEEDNDKSTDSNTTTNVNIAQQQPELRPPRQGAVEGCPKPRVCPKNCFVNINKNGCQDCQCLWQSLNNDEYQPPTGKGTANKI